MGSSRHLASNIDPTMVTFWDIPDKWTFAEAATIPMAYVTAYLALLIRGNLKPLETILIHGGAN
ncbi:unnamed protein product, partial [Allacma fusca]